MYSPDSHCRHPSLHVSLPLGPCCLGYCTRRPDLLLCILPYPHINSCRHCTSAMECSGEEPARRGCQGGCQALSCLACFLPLCVHASSFVIRLSMVGLSRLNMVGLRCPGPVCWSQFHVCWSQLHVSPGFLTQGVVGIDQVLRNTIAREGSALSNACHLSSPGLVETPNTPSA